MKNNFTSNYAKYLCGIITEEQFYELKKIEESTVADYLGADVGDVVSAGASAVGSLFTKKPTPTPEEQEHLNKYNYNRRNPQAKQKEEKLSHLDRSQLSHNNPHRLQINSIVVPTVTYKYLSHTTSKPMTNFYDQTQYSIEGWDNWLMKTGSAKGKIVDLFKYKYDEGKHYATMTHEPNVPPSYVMIAKVLFEDPSNPSNKKILSFKVQDLEPYDARKEETLISMLNAKPEKGQDNDHWYFPPEMIRKHLTKLGKNF